MKSILEQLSLMTIVVADTGDIDTIKKYLGLFNLIISLQKNTNIGLTFQFNL